MSEIAEAEETRRLYRLLKPYFLPLPTAYDTGTYGPTMVGGTTAGTTTYVIQEGEYVRIGRAVFCSGRVNWTAATGTGDARISLPSVVGATYRSTGSLFVDGITFGGSGVQMLVVPGTQYFTMYTPASNAAATLLTVEAAGLVIFSLTYFV